MSTVTWADSEEKQQKVIDEPSTILIPEDDFERFTLDDKTEEEKQKVKEHVLSFMELF